MNYTDLIPVPDSEFNPFFFNEPQPPAETPYYKIYNDGGHYIATRCVCSQKKPPEHKNKREDIDILFDSLYAAAMQDVLKGIELTAYIKAGILLLFPDYPALDKYIANKIERKQHNLYARKKRFRRKANLNRWNYFVTVTYFYGHFVLRFTSYSNVCTLQNPHNDFVFILPLGSGTERNGRIRRVGISSGALRAVEKNARRLTRVGTGVAHGEMFAAQRKPYGGVLPKRNCTLNNSAPKN